MKLQIKPSEAEPGDIIAGVLTTQPTIASVKTWLNSSAVQITFTDGGVYNTYDHFPITVLRGMVLADTESERVDG